MKSCNGLFSTHLRKILPGNKGFGFTEMVPFFNFFFSLIAGAYIYKKHYNRLINKQTSYETSFLSFFHPLSSLSHPFSRYSVGLLATSTDQYAFRCRILTKKRRNIRVKYSLQINFCIMFWFLTLQNIYGKGTMTKS
jgi:hypothetical protein